MKSKPKEELLRENALLNSALERSNTSETKTRQEMTKMLGFSYSSELGIYGRREENPLSWPQIFFEMGKLVAKRDYVSFTDQLRHLEGEIYQINKHLNESAKKD